MLFFGSGPVWALCSLQRISMWPIYVHSQFPAAACRRRWGWGGGESQTLKACCLWWSPTFSQVWLLRMCGDPKFFTLLDLIRPCPLELALFNGRTFHMYPTAIIHSEQSFSVSSRPVSHGLSRPITKLSGWSWGLRPPSLLHFYSPGKFDALMTF